MGFLSSLFRPMGNYSPTSDFWYRPLPGQSAGAGPVNDPVTAMHVSAFFNGVRILAETLAQPPLILYERDGEDQKIKARETVLYSVLHDQPNSFQSSYDYRVQQMTNLLLWGNSYSEIISGSRGAVMELIPLIPSRMRPYKMPNGSIGYIYRPLSGDSIPYAQDEIFHVRAFPLTDDGLLGQSVIAYARQTLGLALTTESFGARLFENSAMHSGVLSVPITLNKPQRDAMREEIKKVHSGDRGWASTMILEAGTKWESVSMNSDDAEFLLTRKFEVVEIARWLNIAPHMLKDLERATFSNIEQQSLEFLQITMMPWFINWEQAIMRDLIMQKNRFFVEFLVDGLVRADIKTRYDAYSTAINTGFMDRNEVRVKENLNRRDGLDKFLVDQNKAIVDNQGNVQPINQPTEARPALPQPPRRLPPPSGHYDKLVSANARHTMRTEAEKIAKSLGKIGENHEKAWAWADKYYSDFAHFVGDMMQLDEKTATDFAQKEKDRFLLSHKSECLKALIDELRTNDGQELINLIGRSDNGNGKSHTADMVAA